MFENNDTHVSRRAHEDTESNEEQIPDIVPFVPIEITDEDHHDHDHASHHQGLNSSTPHDHKKHHRNHYSSDSDDSKNYFNTFEKSSCPSDPNMTFEDYLVWLQTADKYIAKECVYEQTETWFACSFLFVLFFFGGMQLYI